MIRQVQVWVNWKLGVNKIHTDTTYKLIWQGFPCLIIGTTDMIKQFHPYGFAVCFNEKEKDFKFIFMCIRNGLRDLNLDMNEGSFVLIADGSNAIRNAFSEVFGMDHSMVMYWAHMRERAEKKLCLIDDKNLHTGIMEQRGRIYSKW